MAQWFLIAFLLRFLHLHLLFCHHVVKPQVFLLLLLLLVCLFFHNRASHRIITVVGRGLWQRQKNEEKTKKTGVYYEKRETEWG